MAPLTPISNRASGHHGASLPPHNGRGGGDGRGGDDGTPDVPNYMPDSMPNYGERLRRARLGLAIVMTPIAMLFISFTAVYLIRRGFLSFDQSQMAYIRSWIPVRLPWLALLLNTGILVVSSITVDMARRGITREAALAPVQSIPGVSLGDERHVPWLSITTVLGLAFLGGQLFVWSKLSAGGFHLAGGTSSSFVYILTAMHGLHLAGGILALIFANIAAVLHRPVETRRIVVDITSWYWHCMTGLWIYILVLFSFAAQ
jgi:cytochrome c oxidase subunit III